MNLNLARFSVSRPVAAGIASVALFLMGLWYAGRMPVSLYPEVSLPFVSVVVPLPGASAEQIEQKIAKPLEKDLASIKGAKRVIAHVRPGFAQMIVAFKMDVDEREAVNDVREKTSARRIDFPKDTKDPVVSRVDVGAQPVLIYGIESAAAPEATKKLLDDGLVRELQRTEGVGEAEVVGLGDEQVEITLDPAKLSALRIAPLDVYQQLSQRIATVPWGDVRQNGQVLSVSRGTLPPDPKYWDEHVLTLADGRTLRLGEIATTHIAREEDASVVRINGKPGLGLVITKRADANTLDVVKRAEKSVAALDPALGVKLFPIIDQSDYIQANTHEVWIALFAGGAFAVLVVLFFLTDVKSALITATALPVSVAGTFIFMSWLGFSVNMMSLLALALAIGLLIDDAVVVRESIFSEIEKGKSAREAAVTGTDKVATAVIATSLAVIAVFLPVSAMSGMVGQFFKEFGLTIVVAVTLSTWVAFTLDPMLSARFTGAHKPLAGRFWDAWRAFLEKLEHTASGFADRAFRRPLPIILAAVVMLVGSTALVLSRGADFLAFEDRAQLIVNIAAPSGSPKELTEKLADDAYSRIKDTPGLVDVYAKVGGQDESRAEMRLVFVDKTKREHGLIAIQGMLREKLAGIGADVLVLEPPPVEGVGAEAPLTIYVYGEEFDSLFAEAERVAAEVRKIPGVGGLRLETSRHSPGLDVELNHQELGFWSATPQAVELTGRLALTGMEAGNVGEGNLPVLVRYGRDQRTLSALWNDTYVPTPKGPVLLSSLAKADEAVTPTRIDREKRSRKVVLFGTLDRTRSYGNVLTDVEGVLAGVTAPMHAEVAGDKEMFDEMSTNFAIAIVGSAFFIFIILAVQFENLLRPFVILTTLPLAAIGAFLGLWLAGEKLALGALIGIVLLIGLAAKNGILLVDAIGTKEREGDKSLRDAVMDSVRERFRPILMTSVAMIFGMLPTALLRGSGSEFRAPMAIAIIGGVISSTILTVVIVPSIFGVIDRLQARFGRRSKVAGEQSRGARVLAVAGKVGGALLIAGLLAFAAREAMAQDAVAQEPATQEPAADMAAVARLLVAPPAADSREGYAVQAVSEAADGLTAASRLAFLGGLKAEASREWTSPGVTQDLTLPLPPQLGGPVSSEIVLVPKAQNVFTVGWGLPLFNMQTIRGLEVAAATRDQRDTVKRLQHETAARSKAQLLLQYEMAQKLHRAQTKRVEVSEQRVRTVETRVAAGAARRMQLEEATATLEAARADLRRATSELERLRVTFRLEGGAELPAAGFGLTSFPLAADKPFDPVTLHALQGAERIHEASASVVDSSFHPTLEASVAHQRKMYGAGEPDPQNVVALKASWTLLDAGSRRRNMADASRATFQARSETAGARTQLRAAYDTIKTRREGAEHGLAARKAALRAANQAVADSVAAFQSGTAKMLDVRLADEARFNAEVGVFQSELELQALAVESLVLTGGFLPYLEQAAR